MTVACLIKITVVFQWVAGIPMSMVTTTQILIALPGHGWWL